MVVTDFIMFSFIAAVGLILGQVLKTIVVLQMVRKAGRGKGIMLLPWPKFLADWSLTRANRVFPLHFHLEKETFQDNYPS